MDIKAKLARIEAGKTQIQIQLETGISASLISLYERRILTPSPNHARRLNEALNRDIYDEASIKKLRSNRKRSVNHE